MNKGRFINRKLAKRPGYAQKQARLALETQKRWKPGIPLEKQRAIIDSNGPAGKGAEENRRGSCEIVEKL